jgi:four helix bundle protein
LESQHWTDVAFDCGYLKEEQHALLVANLSEIGKMLYAMMAKADQFCGALDH